MRKLCLLVALCCVATATWAQLNLPYTASQLRQMERLSAEMDKAERESMLKTIELARKNNWILGETRSDGRVVRLRGVNSIGEPLYDITDNNSQSANASRTNSVYSGGSLGLNLNGSSTQMNGKLAIWDGGKVLNTHTEFGGRVTQLDNASTVDNHATHTSGTLIAGGINSLAKGMAWGANLKAYDFSSDFAEMTTEAPNLLISNHSYGSFSGFVLNSSRSTAIKWEWWGNTNISQDEDYKFGFYDNTASGWDKLMFNAPYYLIVKSAGNKRSETGPAAGQYYFLGSSTRDSSNVARSRNDAYDTLPTYSNSKNALIVGAVNAMTAAPNASSAIQMSSFSSWGPTDDGRIKPDISGVGVGVLSTSSNGGYASLSGTSMSSPHVAGSLFLLQELYSQLNDKQFMRSATLKGLVIHTAEEAGDAAGPDYRFGWGFLNVEKAAKVIQNTDKNHLLLEKVLAQGETFSQQVIASGNGPLVATIAWTDPDSEATPVTGVNLNNRTPKLINDLDIRISDGATTLLPWVLDPEKPSQAATRGDNIRDNVEQVLIANAVAGKTYTITVTHKGNISRGPQNYALIMSGIGGKAYCASAASSSADSKITKVVFGTISNTAPAGCAAFTDFTNLTAEVSVSQSISLEVSLGTCGANADKIAKVFIDWNGDEDFEDANELVATTGIINGAGTFSSTIVVPAGVVVGTSCRMRVVCVETNNATNVVACGAYTKGETQEYRIAFVRPTKDVMMVSLVSPEDNFCTSSTQKNVVMRLRNVGTQTQTNIPISVQIVENSTVVATLNGTYQGTLNPFDEDQATLTGTFNAKPGVQYQFRLATNLAGDLDPSNNQLTISRTVSPLNANPVGSAVNCSNTLRLDGSGNGTVFWYDAPAGGNLIVAGNKATIASRSVGSMVYASLNEYAGIIGKAQKTAFAKGGYGQFTPAVRVTTQAPVNLESARLYIGSPGKITFTVQRASDGALVSSVTINVKATRTPAAAGTQTDDPTDPGEVYALNLAIPTPGDYQIAISYQDGATIYRNNEIATSPYPLTLSGIMSITGTTATTTPDAFYYYFYDLKVGALGCPAGARTPITVVNGQASIASIGGDKTQSYCPNSSIVLSANTGGVSYQWQRNGQNITNATQSTLSVNAIGTYRVTVTESGRCPFTSDTVRVSAKTPAMPVISRNDNVLSSNIGSNFQWRLNSQDISGATNASFTALQSGSYTVRATVDGCTVESANLVFFITAIDEPSPTRATIKLYPNPATERLAIEYSPSDTPTNVEVTLLNVLGVPLLQKALIQQGKNFATEIELASVAIGTIFVKISDGKQVFIKKIVKL